MIKPLTGLNTWPTQFSSALIQTSETENRLFFNSSHSWPWMPLASDSNRKCDLSLDYMLPRKSSLSSDSNKTYCMLGHCLHAPEDVPKPGARWDMGTMLLFNGTVWSWLYCVQSPMLSTFPFKIPHTPQQMQGTKWRNKDQIWHK